MSRSSTKTCLLAGLTVAILAVGGASAAEPIRNSKPAAAKQPLSAKQKHDLATAMARSHAARAAAPKTIAQANETIMVGSDGTVSVEVPQDLHNYLTAQPDANGRMRVRDTDPNAQPAAAVEATNEK